MFPSLYVIGGMVSGLPAAVVVLEGVDGTVEVGRYGLCYAARVNPCVIKINPARQQVDGAALHEHPAGLCLVDSFHGYVCLVYLLILWNFSNALFERSQTPLFPSGDSIKGRHSPPTALIASLEGFVSP